MRVIRVVVNWALTVTLSLWALTVTLSLWAPIAIVWPGLFGDETDRRYFRRYFVTGDDFLWRE